MEGCALSDEAEDAPHPAGVLATRARVGARGATPQRARNALSERPPRYEFALALRN